MDEDHPLNPRCRSGDQGRGDRLVYSYWCTYGTPAVVVRPFNNYGPYQHPEKVIPRFITAALQDRPLTVHGGGAASRDWLTSRTPRRRSRRSSGAARAHLGRGAERCDRGRRGRPEHRRAHLRQPRQAASLIATSPTGPARSTATSARPTRWPSSSAGAPVSASTRASSARSAGTPRTRPGGRRMSRPSARRTPLRRPLIVLGAGAGQFGAYAAARRLGVETIACDATPTRSACARASPTASSEISAMDACAVGHWPGASAPAACLAGHGRAGAGRRRGGGRARAAPSDRRRHRGARDRQARAARVRSIARACRNRAWSEDGTGLPRGARVVVKPAAAQGQRGIEIVEPGGDSAEAVAAALATSRDGRALVRGVRRRPGADRQRIPDEGPLRPADGHRSRARARVRRSDGASLSVAAPRGATSWRPRRPPAGRSASAAGRRTRRCC